jgi:hypothetical protein
MEHQQYLSEQQVREQIDQKLVQSGRVIQDKKQLNLYESLDGANSGNGAEQPGRYAKSKTFCTNRRPHFS